MTKEVILAKYRTVEEMAVLAKSLTAAQHHEAATEVVDRLQGLVEAFKQDLDSSLEVLETELSGAKKHVAELEAKVPAAGETQA